MLPILNHRGIQVATGIHGRRAHHLQLALTLVAEGLRLFQAAPQSQALRAGGEGIFIVNAEYLLERQQLEAEQDEEQGGCRGEAPGPVRREKLNRRGRARPLAASARQAAGRAATCRLSAGRARRT
jgi:hypothetical protein